VPESLVPRQKTLLLENQEGKTDGPLLNIGGEDEGSN